MGITSCCLGRSNVNNIRQHDIKQSVILGMSSVGKSTFFNTIQRLYPNSDSLIMNPGNFESDLQLVTANIIHTILVSVKSSENYELKDFLSDELEKVNLTTDTIAFHLRYSECKCSELLIKLWKLPNFRKFYESQFIDRKNRMNENVEELVLRIESNIRFQPLSLCFCYQSGSIELISHYVGLNDKEMDFIELGGKENHRRRLLNAIGNICVVVYMVSLSEFNQFVLDGKNRLRMDEGLEKATRMLCHISYGECRKILLFTKPDVLMRKLRKGVKYEREMDYDIRPELNGIDQYQDKIVVNSIVNEYLKKLEKAELDSYHIINTTKEEEVNLILNKVIYQNQQKTIISPCLLPVIYSIQSKLYNICKRQLLTDILII